MADATEALRTLRIAHAELQRRCRKQSKQLKDKDTASVGKNATLQAENLSLRQRTKHLSQKLKAVQEHSEKARLTYQRRSTAEAAGSGAVRAAEEFCRRAEAAEERTREALQENAELQNHVKQLKSALTLQGKQITFSGNAPATPKDALESYLASEDVLGVASPSVQARSPNVHDGSTEVWHTRYDEASKRLAEAERTASDQAVMIAGLQQQIARDAGRPPPSPEALHFGRREPEPFDTFPPIEASSARDEPTDYASTRDEPPDFETPDRRRESLPPIDDVALKRAEEVKAELRLIRESQEELVRSFRERPAEPVAVEKDSAALVNARKRAQDAEDALAKLRDEKEKLEATARALRDDLDNRDKIVRELRNDVAARDGRIAELETKARVASLSFGDVEAKLEAAAAARAEAEERVKEATAARDKAEGRRAEAFRAREDADAAREAAEVKLEEAVARADAAEARLAEISAAAPAPVARATPARPTTADLPLSAGSPLSPDAPPALAAGPLSPRDPPTSMSPRRGAPTPAAPAASTVAPAAVSAVAPASKPAAAAPPAEVSPDKATAAAFAARVDAAAAAAFAAGQAAAAVNLRPPAPAAPRELPRVWWSTPGE
jgi:hypothetical protein